MKENTRSIILFGVGILILFLVFKNEINLIPTISTPTEFSQPRTATMTFTPTITLTPTPTLANTTFYAAVVKVDSVCYSGTSILYQELNIIDQYKIVMVLRKNIANDWFLIRWEGVDCWIQSNLLQFDFDINDLLVTSTPPAPTFTPTLTKAATFIVPTKTSKPDQSSNGPDNSAGQTQAAMVQTQAAQTQTAQAAIAQTQAAQAQTAQAAIAQTQAAQAQTAQAAIAQTQTAQAQTAQAAIAQTQTAQAQTAQAAIAQTQTAQALTAQAAYWQTQTALACIISAPKLSGSRNGQNVRLSWSSVSGASSYEVFVSVNGGPESSLGKTNGTSANDSISNGSTNVYHIVAYSPCGNKYNTDSNAETIVR